MKTNLNDRKWTLGRTSGIKSATPSSPEETMNTQRRLRQNLKLASMAARSMLPIAALFLAAFSAQAASRPIQEFIDRQGSYVFAVNADGSVDCANSYYSTRLDLNARNLLGWTDAESYMCLFDYAGLIDGAGGFGSPGQLLGTTMDGTVVERPLPDGRAEVSVVLHSRNVNACAFDPNFEFTFGYNYYPPSTWPDGDEPAIGDTVLTVKFINPAPGYPLPDVIQLAICPEPFQEVLAWSFEGSAKGVLREASGYPEGTPGFLHTRQVGLIAVYARLSSKPWQTNPGPGAHRSGWPAEKIILQPVGH